MKILVVDDHVLVREGLRKVLGQLEPDVEIHEADTAEAAYEAAQAHPALDLIVLDLALPGTSGMQALSTLRRTHADIPVVVLSASSEISDMTAAIQAGAAGFIPKSSGAGVMLGAVRLVLSGGIYVPPELLVAQGILQNDLDTPPASLAALRAARRELDPRALGLTERQAQVLARVVQGKSNKVIGRELNLAEPTVKAHMTAALRALNVTSRTQAVIAVAQLGIRFDEGAAARDVDPGC